MIKIIFCCLFLALSFSSFSNNIVDLYFDEKNSNEIIKKYSKKVSDIEIFLRKNQFNKYFYIKNKIFDVKNRKKELIERIKKEYGFLYVDFDTVSYPDTETTYTTIEVITKEHPERQRFISKESTVENTKGKTLKRHDLIDDMTRYIDEVSELFLSGNLSQSGDCPVYHCMGGFSHAKLRPYLQRFNQGALRDRKLILDTLRNDPDSIRRSSAVFLVGHFRNPRDIMTVLKPYVTDNNASVRNNAMRVLGETVLRSHIILNSAVESRATDLDVMPFLDLLDSPYDTDRNKALLMIYLLTDSKESRETIRKFGRDKLIQLSHLKQPNNRDFSCLILKKLLGVRSCL